MQVRGVSKLRLIDFDYVTLSSLNRHATATRADVGIPKTQSLKQAITAVVPWVEVETCVELWNVENEKENGWLEGADWIVDAIDNITTKVNTKLNKFVIISPSFTTHMDHLTHYIAG